MPGAREAYTLTIPATEGQKKPYRLRQNMHATKILMIKSLDMGGMNGNWPRFA